MDQAPATAANNRQPGTGSVLSAAPDDSRAAAEVGAAATGSTAAPRRVDPAPGATAHGNRRARAHPVRATTTSVRGTHVDALSTVGALCTSRAVSGPRTAASTSRGPRAHCTTSATVGPSVVRSRGSRTDAALRTPPNAVCRPRAGSVPGGMGARISECAHLGRAATARPTADRTAVGRGRGPRIPWCPLRSRRRHVQTW